MWYEFPIPADPKKQREIIRQLRKWIESLESRGVVKGFAFDHCSPNPEELRIRFDTDEENLKTVRKELENEVKKLRPNYVLPPEDRLWDGGKNKEQVYRAYEFGSSCAFLAWELIENERFPEEYFSDFYIREDAEGTIVKQIPVKFQKHFNHGVMNSLGISSYPNEALIHLYLLMNSIKSKNKQELIDWIEKRSPKRIIEQ
jgi:hypothetical protein